MQMQVVGVLKALFNIPEPDENETAFKDAVRDLARKIREVDKKGPAGATLIKFMKGMNASFNRANWLAIHKFLLKHGHAGLDTVRIFEPEHLLSSLVETGRLTFFLPPFVADGGASMPTSVGAIEAYCSPCCPRPDGPGVMSAISFFQRLMRRALNPQVCVSPAR